MRLLAGPELKRASSMCAGLPWNRFKKMLLIQSLCKLIVAALSLEILIVAKMRNDDMSDD
jgi:hypothetical protein